MKHRNTPDKLICAYCGAEKIEITFCIGASRKPDWTMIEGTGKMTCPDCYARASAEGIVAINGHIARYNQAGRTNMENETKKYTVHCATCGDLATTNDISEAQQLASKHRFGRRHIAWVKNADRKGIIQLHP